MRGYTISMELSQDCMRTTRPNCQFHCNSSYEIIQFPLKLSIVNAPPTVMNYIESIFTTTTTAAKDIINVKVNSIQHFFPLHTYYSNFIHHISCTLQLQSNGLTGCKGEAFLWILKRNFVFVVSSERKYLNLNNT